MAKTTRDFEPRRANSRRSRARANFILLVVAVLILIVGIAAWSTDNYLWRLPASHSNSNARALVMDQLALNYPDPSFTTNITNALKTAGYAVDYSGPTPTAVDIFRQLPKQGYDLVIIRAHTGSSQSIITAEPYSQSEFVADQLSGRLVPAQVEGGPLYFALTPKFVRQDMVGRFPESMIIVMGCSALEGTQDIASAFLDRGANFFVGWDSSVSIIHTDVSTVALVRMLSAGSSWPEATNRAGGTDPVYGAKLQYLDWNTLVRSRTSDLISKLLVWVVLASLIVIGPTTVFVAPKLIASLDRVRERVVTRGKEKLTSNDDRTVKK
jgi:hypothetical protein